MLCITYPLPSVVVALGDFRVCGAFGVGVPGVWVCAHPQQACMVCFVRASACCVGLGRFECVVESDSRCRRSLKNARVWAGVHCVVQWCVRLLCDSGFLGAACTFLASIASHRIASNRIAQNRIAPHRIAPHCIASHRIQSHTIASTCTILITNKIIS